jgi:hypothetical protein
LALNQAPSSTDSESWAGGGEGILGDDMKKLYLLYRHWATENCMINTFNGNQGRCA